MPFLTIYTNGNNANMSIIAEEAAHIVAFELNKPLPYVVVNIIHNPAMAYNCLLYTSPSPRD